MSGGAGAAGAAPKVNKHGLSRTIPADVRRIVRQRDGFGCVVCGGAVIDYEHFDPPYADAKEHKPEGICLLCPTCHRKKGSFISPESLRAAIKNPRAKQVGFSFEGPFDPGTDRPEIRIGPLTATDTPCILQIRDEKVLWIDPPEKPGGPFRISALFRDSRGRVILSIDKNVFALPTSNWDFTLKGNKLSINEKKYVNSLEMTLIPGRGIDISRLNFQHRDLRVQTSSGKPLEFEAGSNTRISADELEIHNCETAIFYDGSIHFGIGGASRGTGTIEVTLPPARSVILRIPPEPKNLRKTDLLTGISLAALIADGRLHE